jgi:hypothetical protein
VLAARGRMRGLFLTTNSGGGKLTLPAALTSGAVPPVGLLHCRRTALSGQDADRPGALRRPQPRCRRCLLKGCERWFLPARPQARYCSPGCQQSARRWRRWLATQRYRASDSGKARRRDQSRRYRLRLRQRPVAEPVAVTTEPVATTAAAPADRAEGQRPAEFPEVTAGPPCQRPGCYACFQPSPRSPQQRFCCPSCRQALRRVRQREVACRQRRRHGARPRRVRARPPP